MEFKCYSIQQTRTEVPKAAGVVLNKDMQAAARSHRACEYTSYVYAKTLSSSCFDMAASGSDRHSRQRQCFQDETHYALVSDDRLAQLSIITDYWRAAEKECQSTHLPLLLCILFNCFGMQLVILSEPVQTQRITTQHPRQAVTKRAILHMLQRVGIGDAWQNGATVADIDDAIQDLLHRGVIVGIDLQDVLLRVCDMLPATLVELIVAYTHESLADELIRMAGEHKQELLKREGPIEDLNRWSPLYHRAVAASKSSATSSSFVYPLIDEDHDDKTDDVPLQGQHSHTCHHAGVLIDTSHDLASVLLLTDHCEMPEFQWPNVEVLILASDAPDFTGPVDDFEAIRIRCPKLRLIEWSFLVSDYTDGHPFYRRGYCTDFSNPHRSMFQYCN